MKYTVKQAQNLKDGDLITVNGITAMVRSSVTENGETVLRFSDGTVLRVAAKIRLK